jgi:hypothetical protein
MSELIGIIGTIGTFVFGGLYVWQLIQERISKRVRESEREHVAALGQALAHIRNMCSEAIESGEIIKSDASKQFVRQIGWSLLTAEKHVAAIEKSFMSDKERKKPAS